MDDSTPRAGLRARARTYLSPSLLVLAGALLGLGGVLHALGAGASGDQLWMAAGALGAAYSAWNVADSMRRRSLGVDVVALLALVGAMVVGELLAASVIALMVASGRALESWAAGRAHHDLRALVSRAPRTARRRVGERLDVVPVEEVVPGDVLVVGTGELVPVDGVLLSAAVLDESVLTGESLPVEAGAGEPVRSGAVNAGSAFDLAVTAAASHSAYAGIVRLVQEAESARAPFVRMADRYALWFLPLSVGAAAVAWVAGGAGRAVAVLVVATPCPLILAAPIALVAGLSRAARRGVVIKGGGVLERLARCTTMLVDKTGTLTSGRPVLSAALGATSWSTEDLLRFAGSVDQVSAHVLARAVVHAALDRGLTLELPHDVEEVPGQGIRGVVDAHRIALGKAAWVGVAGAPPWAKSARRRARLDGSLTVFVGVDGEPAGVLLFDDPVRADAGRTVRALRASGVDRIVMVSGDRSEVAETVGAVIGVDDVFAERSPEEKLDVVRAERVRAPTVMVGDGINDAPALALADVGVAMGARGATASSETADVVLAVDRLDRLGEARRIARRSRDIALQSVVAGMGLSLVAMALAGLGYLPAVGGALLQEGIDVAVILNALRALRAPAGELRLAEEESAITRRFQDEHVAVRAVLDRLRVAADALGAADPGAAMARVREVHRLLVDEVVPHERAEEELLYPALNRLFGAAEATGPMSRGHVEIAHQIRRLGQLLDDIGPSGPDDEDVEELRRLLYGLHAVLRLHTAQEDESYLSLGDDGSGHAEPATSSFGQRANS